MTRSFILFVFFLFSFGLNGFADVTPFTGKITKNKVRMRLQPNLDGFILRELDKDDMIVVLGETEDFYAVLPPSDIKAYIFRTFVLDNMVEGNHVNVRLEPTLEGPVIAQLNTGDIVEGRISPLNSKWLEIAPPQSSRFYVCKDYIERIGDSKLMASIEKRREEVNNLLNSTYLEAQTEMAKHFQEIQLDQILANYAQIITEYSDFPEQAGRAKELQKSLQEDYLKKKIAYLEANSSNNSHVSVNNKAEIILKNPEKKEIVLQGRMGLWTPVENEIYESWVYNNGKGTMEEFYIDQEQKSVILRGIIEPYNRSVKHKPGDFVLLNRSNHLPIAYLYSTKVPLQDLIGQEVSIVAAPRPNHNFAYPAFFVLGLQ